MEAIRVKILDPQTESRFRDPEEPNLIEIDRKKNSQKAHSANEATLQKPGFDILTIVPDHTLHVTTLPSHHRDPFDRMLVAQALLEHPSLITYDSSSKRDGVKVL